MRALADRPCRNSIGAGAGDSHRASRLDTAAGLSGNPCPRFAMGRSSCYLSRCEYCPVSATPFFHPRGHRWRWSCQGNAAGPSPPGDATEHARTSRTGACHTPHLGRDNAAVLAGCRAGCSDLLFHRSRSFLARLRSRCTCTRTGVHLDVLPVCRHVRVNTWPIDLGVFLVTRTTYPTVRSSRRAAEFQSLGAR